MMNVEKYIDDILKTTNCDFGFNKHDRKIINCDSKFCEDCLFSQKSRKIDEPSCNVAKLKWLISENKSPIKVSILEYRILNYCLSKNYNYISRRGISNMLIVSECKLKKREYNFIESDGDWTSLCLFDDLFQFIKLGDDSTSIKEILKNSEVIEDA